MCECGATPASMMAGTRRPVLAASQAAPLLLVALLWLAPRSALALGCEGMPRMTDSFVEVDASWKADANPPTVEENRLKVKPPEEGKTLIYRGIRLDQGEICVTLRSPNAYSDASGAEAGIVFRATRIPATEDYSYCFFGLSPDGTARLSDCRVEPSWVLNKSWPQLSVIRKGEGAKNELRVTLQRGALGTIITLWVNDTKLELGSVPFPPLMGGGEVGLRAVSETGKTDTWKFSDFSANELP
jgi:hypothetical protein